MCVSEEICYAVHSYWPFLDCRPVQVGLELEEIGHETLLLWMCVSEEIYVMPFILTGHSLITDQCDLFACVYTHVDLSL